MSKSPFLTYADGAAPGRVGWRALLGSAASGLILLGACQTGPSAAQIQASDWAQAARTDTPIAYAIYMRTHPDGPFRGMAEARIEELKALDEQAFAAAREKDTEQAYADYLASHPWGAHAREADGRRAFLAAPRLASEENVEWAEAQTIDRIEQYESFLDNWPRGAHAQAARQRLAELWKTDQGEFVKAKRSGSPLELSAFIRRHPESTYASDARLEIDLLERRDEEAWRRAFAANSIAAFDSYLIAQPYGRWRVEAQQAIDQLRDRDYQAWRQAAALDEIWAYEEYRLRYPWGSWYDTAFYRIDWIRGGRYYDAWNSRWNYGWDRGWRWGHSDRDGRRDLDEPNTYPPLFSGQKRPEPRSDGSPQSGPPPSPPAGDTRSPPHPGLWSDNDGSGRQDYRDQNGRIDDDGANAYPPLFGGKRRPAPQSDTNPQSLPPPSQPPQGTLLPPQPGLWSDGPGAARAPGSGPPPVVNPPLSWSQPSPPPPMRAPEPQLFAPAPSPAAQPPASQAPPRNVVDEPRQDEF